MIPMASEVQQRWRSGNPTDCAEETFGIAVCAVLLEKRRNDIATNWVKRP
jgi:hypothetical protein